MAASMMSYKNIASATTTLVYTGHGRLGAIIVNKAVASSVITIYDGIAAATGTKIGTVTNPATLLHSQMVLPYNAAFAVGLCIVTSQADDITVCWQPM